MDCRGNLGRTRRPGQAAKPKKVASLEQLACAKELFARKHSFVRVPNALERSGSRQSLSLHPWSCNDGCCCLHESTACLYRSCLHRWRMPTSRTVNCNTSFPFPSRQMHPPLHKPHPRCKEVITI